MAASITVVAVTMMIACPRVLSIRVVRTTCLLRRPPPPLRTYQNGRRTLSSSAGSAPPSAPNKNEPAAEPELVLYERRTDPSTTIMRSGLFFSTFHTGYWIWYITEFIPMVNQQSSMPELHIDPALGYGGLFCAALLNAAFLVYPKRLVSKLAYRPQSQKIMVYTHRLPIVRPNEFPSASFPVGGTSDVSASSTRNSNKGGGDDSEKQNNSLKYFQLNSKSLAQIIQQVKKRSDFDLSQDFRGVLAAGPSRPYYNIPIMGPKDVPEPELLLEALLRPEQFGKDFYSSLQEPHAGADNDEQRLSSWRTRPRRKKATGRVQKMSHRRR